MAPKRRSSSVRTVPYDPDLVENWTISRLREELRSKNIAYRSADKRMVLARKLREARQSETGSVPPFVPHRRVAASQDATGQDGGAEVPRQQQQTNRVETLITMVTSLSESVASLQDSYLRLENRVERQNQRHAAAAGSEHQTARGSTSTHVPVASTATITEPLPQPVSSQEFTLDSAYRGLEATDNNQDASFSTAGSASRQTACSVSSPGIAVHDLNDDVDLLWDSALSRSTQATYQSGLNCFLTFVLMQGIGFPKNFLPQINEDLLILFVTHCQRTLHLKYETIKLYLAGVRFHYIKQKFGDPTANTLRLAYILRAIKRSQVNIASKRLPITFSVLSKMCNAIAFHGMFEPFTDLMLLCIFKTAFYGFLRCGEFTCKSLWDSNFIRLCDVHVSPDLSCFTLSLRLSKTDPFGKGVDINVFENDLLNPVSTMHRYLMLRNSSDADPSSPLFLDQVHSSRPLMRHTFIGHLKECLTRVGLDNGSFNGHSFRIGASTSAAAAGVEDHVIQTLGRWSSDCFIRYIRTEPVTIRRAQLQMSF
ncbi:uncharacterized protein [Argopecten irradians]|uniref:uncharacterized protein n=1 Tax=Argopecten irradians TaxID=31199 RepID=UPI003722BB4B